MLFVASGPLILPLSCALPSTRWVVLVCLCNHSVISRGIKYHQKQCNSVSKYNFGELGVIMELYLFEGSHKGPPPDKGQNNSTVYWHIVYIYLNQLNTSCLLHFINITQIDNVDIHLTIKVKKIFGYFYNNLVGEHTCIFSFLDISCSHCSEPFSRLTDNSSFWFFNSYIMRQSDAYYISI